MLSFICASNNPQMYRDCVEKSLRAQRNQDFELICVDTVKTHYASAAQALNAGARGAKGDYLVFLHQDIVIEDCAFVDKLLACIAERDFLIAGVAGAVERRSKWRKDIYSGIVHGENREPAGIALAQTRACRTLDECLFIIPREVYARRPLLEFCPTWHLYAVEYCLWAQGERPGSVLVFPLELWHLSAGASFNAEYFAALKHLTGMYRKGHAFIYTTMGAWPTNRLLLWLRNKLRRTKYEQ